LVDALLSKLPTRAKEEQKRGAGFQVDRH
jgi:hypothetical protein